MEEVEKDKGEKKTGESGEKDRRRRRESEPEEGRKAEEEEWKAKREGVKRRQKPALKWPITMKILQRPCCSGSVNGAIKFM